MENLPTQIFKFAQVFSTSRKKDIEKIFYDNEFETKNSLPILTWDFIYRDIVNTAKVNGLISPTMCMGALWTARGVIIEGVLYVFMMKKRFEDVTNKYEKHHYLTCIARSKNSQLNGKEEGKLSIELFNDLDDDELSASQIEQAKKLLGDYYNFIDEIRVVTFDKKTNAPKPQEPAEQPEKPASVEELEEQVLKQNDLGKPVELEESKEEDKK